MLDELTEVLSDRYGEALTSLSAAPYRDGADSVAWHGDRHAREVDHSMVAIISLGEPRRFLLRPKPSPNGRSGQKQA